MVLKTQVILNECAPFKDFPLLLVVGFHHLTVIQQIHPTLFLLSLILELTFTINMESDFTVGPVHPL